MYKTIIAGKHITMNPTFYKITVCQIITLFGNAALRFALPLYLLRRTDSAALFQILLFTAIQAHAPTGQTGRFMSLITVCACLTQPAGQAALGLFVCMASLPLCPVPCFLRRLQHRIFSKKPFLFQNHERFFTNLLKSSY